MRVIHVVNRILSKKHFEESGKRYVSALTRDTVIERVTEYLKVFNWEVPPDFKLEHVRFNKSHGSWDVRWRRFSGQYPWDEHTTETETMVAEIDEKDGLLFIVNHSCFPPPKNLEVKVTKDQAVARAWEYVGSTRHLALILLHSGYVATKLKSAELKVAAPRFRLDPKGTKFIQDVAVPKETRLCWVVTIYIENPKTKNDALQIGLPGIPVIYVEAATGEVLGFDLDSSYE